MQTFVLQNCSIEQYSAVVYEMVTLTRALDERYEPVFELSNGALHVQTRYTGPSEHSWSSHL